ncbi:hypothetical protein B0H13DRAFT_2539029 [Mycena leptocephala]|nr:hypothetical protein B0H13DRAFT_2539029 [Mycena leptocephala]
MSGPFTTLTRPARFINVNPSSPSSFERKRRRLNSGGSSSASRTGPGLLPTLPILPHSPYRFNSRNEVEENPSPSTLTPTRPALASTSEQPAPALSGMERSIAVMEARSQTIRQEVAAEEQSDKETADTYARQAELSREDPTWVVVPAFPVTAFKVAIFLKHETTRPQKRKRADGSDSTATVGVHRRLGKISHTIHSSVHYVDVERWGLWDRPDWANTSGFMTRSTIVRGKGSGFGEAAISSSDSRKRKLERVDELEIREVGAMRLQLSEGQELGIYPERLE